MYVQLRKAAFISLFLSCPACPFKRLRIDGLVRPRSPWTNSCSRFTHGELVAMFKRHEKDRVTWVIPSIGCWNQCQAMLENLRNCVNCDMWDAEKVFFPCLFASEWLQSQPLASWMHSTMSVAVACHLSSKNDIPPYLGMSSQWKWM